MSFLFTAHQTRSLVRTELSFVLNVFSEPETAGDGKISLGTGTGKALHWARLLGLGVLTFSRWHGVGMTFVLFSRVRVGREGVIRGPAGRGWLNKAVVEGNLRVVVRNCRGSRSGLGPHGKLGPILALVSPILTPVPTYLSPRVACSY